MKEVGRIGLRMVGGRMVMVGRGSAVKAMSTDGMISKNVRRVGGGNTLLEGLQNKQKLGSTRAVEAQIQDRIRSAEATYFMLEDHAKAGRKAAERKAKLAASAPSQQHEEDVAKQSEQSKARVEKAKTIISEKFAVLEHEKRDAGPEMLQSIR
eukprot:1569000-Rhodomonas_salina.1